MAALAVAGAGELRGIGALGKYFGGGGAIFVFWILAGRGRRPMLPPAAEVVAQIPKESVEQVLSATDIVDLINSYVPLKRAGSQFRANCPFHNEKSPSFYVNPSRQSFKCFGCGVGGDAITFVRDYENLPFMEAVKRLASRAGIQIREEESDPEADKQRKSKGRLLDLHREATDFFHQLLMKDPAAGHAREYLKSRGFGSEMAARWKVGWMPDNTQRFLDWAKSRKFTGWELKESGICYLREENNPKSGLRVRFRDRLMFPVCNEIGDVIAYSARQLRADPNSGKYVNSPETALFKKSRVLFGLDRSKKPILKEKAALLCEGQIDVIACHENGVENALAPLGTSFTREHAKLLKRYTGHVLACYDSDKAGVAASERLFRELAPEGLSMRVVCMPEGDDPDTYLKAHGLDEFRKLMQNAKEFFDFKLEHARNQGTLDTAAGRTEALTKCAEALALVSDVAAREDQINTVVAHLRTSATVLRQEIARIKSKPQRSYQDRSDSSAIVEAPAEPTSMHRIVAFLCHLALNSAPAQHLLGEQFETLHEASRWLEGIPLLESILAAAPDPTSNAAVNAFISSLPESDRLALGLEAAIEAAPDDGMQAAEHALALLSGTVLQKRDAAIKAALKEPGLSTERMMELLEEAKEIRSLMQGIGQRSEFDDELPASTFKPKVPEWKKKWQDKGPKG
ncbi:MAG: DNA primase [Akkermansiaceae bacterium]|nr:DNA primase [Akkermansiaceae bacterium]